MRHGCAGRQFGRDTSHRKALLRMLVTSLLKNEKIETTVAKAKEIRPLAEKMITLAKRGDLHARRQALSFINDEAVVSGLVLSDRPSFCLPERRIHQDHSDPDKAGRCCSHGGHRAGRTAEKGSCRRQKRRAKQNRQRLQSIELATSARSYNRIEIAKRQGIHPLPFFIAFTQNCFCVTIYAFFAALSHLMAHIEKYLTAFSGRIHARICPLVGRHWMQSLLFHVGSARPGRRPGRRLFFLAGEKGA